MRKLVKFGGLIIIVVVIGFFLFIKKEDSCNDCESFSDQVKNIISPKKSEKKIDPQVLTPTKIIDTSKMPEVEFNSWVARAAVDLNNPSVDAIETEEELREVSKKLTNPQIELLVKKSLDVEVAINERILSVYLLTMSEGDLKNDSLTLIAQAKLSDLGPINVHSEAEIKKTQDLAIRYMAIDELFRKAKTDEGALHKLKLLLVEAESIEIRNYVQRKLDEMK